VLLKKTKKPKSNHLLFGFLLHQP